MARVINPKAKKYATLREKQAMANRYLKMSKTDMSAYTQRQYLQAQNRLRMFQNKRGLAKKRTFSMQGLTTADVEMYEQLLDSVIENTRLNPEKSEKHKQSQISFYMEEGWANSEEKAEQLYMFTNSDTYDSLREKGLGDIPSKLVEKFGMLVDSGYSMDEFVDMVSVFQKSTSPTTESDYQEFISFSENYIDALHYREDVPKAAEEYLSGDYDMDFFSFLEEF